MAHLPNAESATIDPRKLTDYLLALDHTRGGSKARFLRRFGFDESSVDLLRNALIDHACNHEITSVQNSPHGTKYAIDGPLHTPDGREPMVSTIWIIDLGSDAPRFVTAYPMQSPPTRR